MTKKYFHEVIADQDKALAQSLQQSRIHKKERLDREAKKTESEKSQEELEPIHE